MSGGVSFIISHGEAPRLAVYADHFTYDDLEIPLWLRMMVLYLAAIEPDDVTLR